MCVLRQDQHISSNLIRQLCLSTTRKIGILSGDVIASLFVDVSVPCHVLEPFFLPI